MRKVIITGKAHEILMQQLKLSGLEVVYDPTISYEALLSSMENVEGLVLTTRIHPDLLPATA